MPLLDLAYEVQGRLEGLSTFFPLGGANLIGVLGDVLSSAYFAQELTSVTANTVVVYFVSFDLALGANTKGTAQSYTLFFDQNLEVSGELVGWVSQRGVLDLANSRRAIVPCFVGEMGICRNREYLYTKLLEFFVVLCQVFELCGAHKGEVSRVEHKHGPLAGDALVGELYKLTVVVSHGLERQNLCVDQRHICYLRKSLNESL